MAISPFCFLYEGVGPFRGPMGLCMGPKGLCRGCAWVRRVCAGVRGVCAGVMIGMGTWGGLDHRPPIDERGGMVQEV